MQEKISTVVHEFKSISLEEMNTVALMKRTDTKYVIPFSLLKKILSEVVDDYSVLEIDDKRIMNYSSVYFDTEDYKFYNDHHNGKTNRTKIRQRKYVDSDLTFLEIKKKNGKGETNKSRIKIDDFDLKLSQNAKDFIKNKTKQDFNLTPTLWNNFYRVTLVSLKNKERVTIDLDLNYTIDNEEKSYKKLVVVEVKQEKFDRSSAIVQALKKHHNNPYSISKYCIGMVNLYDNLKSNLFKRKLLKINKISA